MNRNSRHLVAMLDDVLELLRADSRQFAVSPRTQRLCVVVDEVLADVELHAGDPRVANRQHFTRRAAVRDWGSRTHSSPRDARNAY